MAVKSTCNTNVSCTKMENWTQRFEAKASTQSTWSLCVMPHRGGVALTWAVLLGKLDVNSLSKHCCWTLPEILGWDISTCWCVAALRRKIATLSLMTTFFSVQIEGMLPHFSLIWCIPEYIDSLILHPQHWVKGPPAVRKENQLRKRAPYSSSCSL